LKTDPKTTARRKNGAHKSPQAISRRVGQAAPWADYGVEERNLLPGGCRS
jgi:hypothetical protein